MKKITVLVPEYFKHFQCIGSECEDTCCQRWTIFIDKSAYKKLKKLKKNDFNPIHNKHIILNKNKTGFYDYGLIDLNSNKYCPLLNDELLCSLYIRLGEYYMPYVCKMYPREINYTDNDLEISLLLSCPEAARKALLPIEPMAFEYIELDHQKEFEVFLNRLITKGNSIPKEEHRYFWNIRTASIAILQNRKFDIVSRIMLVGLMYNRIEECIHTQNYDQISHEIETYTDQIQKLENQDIFSHLEKNVLLQTYLSKISIEKKRLGNKLSEQFSSYINDSLSILQTEQDDSIDTSDFSTNLSKDVIKEYQTILHEKVVPFLENEGMTIIENFLVNYYFSKMMPFGQYQSIRDSMIVLSSYYMYMKVLLAGQAKSNTQLTKELLINIIYLFSRNIAHDESYNNFILNMIRNAKADNLAGIYTMIFN